MRVTIFDNNPGEGGLWQGFLKTSWMVGSWLQKLFGAVDDYYGASSFADAKAWLESKNTTFSSIQYWGHGSPSTIWLANNPIPTQDWLSLKPLLTEDSLLWFRVCSAFQGEAGQRFSGVLADGLNCTIGGHTMIVGLWQGGLHTRKPHSLPSWPVDEGTHPSKLRDDFKFWNKNTISCLRTTIPQGW
jgi:hypothetical protein